MPWKELAQGSPRLSDLLLSFNNLQGEIPPDLAQMGRWSDTLLGLELEGNRLTGPVPASFGMLKSFIFINLSGNSGLNGTLSDKMFSALPNLQGLDLRDFPMSRALPTECLLNISSLRRVSLAGSSMELSAPTGPLCAWANQAGTKGEHHFCDV